MKEITLPGYAISVLETVDICNNEKMIGYSIHHNINQPNGKGVLYIKKIEELAGGLVHEKELFRLFQNEFPRQTLVSRVESFYPYGEKLISEELEKFSKKGAASTLFRLMEAQALQEKAKLIYTVSGTDSGMSFFRKKGLAEVDIPGFQANLFYKIL